MDNEATKVVEPQKNENEKKEQATGLNLQNSEKKDSNMLGQAAATAVGAAFGTGAAMAADRIYEHATSAIEEESLVDEPATEEPIAEDVAEEEPATEEVQAAAEPQVTTVNHVVTVRVETVNHEPVTAAVESPVPADGEYIDQPEVVAAVDATEDDAADGEVRVIGATAVDTEDGGQAILVGLEAADGDRAMIVDIDSDGTIDYLVHDDNENGNIEENEIYDIHEEGWQTEAYLAAYEEEQSQQGVQDEMMAASDDMPDYMNDADAGLLDA